MLIIWSLTHMKPRDAVPGYLDINLLKFRRICCPAERYGYFLFLYDGNLHRNILFWAIAT